MNRKALRVLSAVAVVGLLATAGIVLGLRERGSTLRLTAYFTESNGIYPGNHVDILGLAVGSVVSVTPEPQRVKVVLSLPADTKVPRNAAAYIVPPSVISDRYVGLSPAWNGGPVLHDGDVIAHGFVPAEFDDLVGSLTSLFQALGPNQANAKGAVSRLLHVLAGNLDGNGRKIHDTIEGLSAAAGAVTHDRGALASVVTNMNALAENLAARDALIGSFNSDLAGAARQLAGERQDITGVVENLSAGLLQVASFVRDHRASLHSGLHDLVVTTNLLLRHQRALIETLDNLPLDGQNIADTALNGQIRVTNIPPQDNTYLAGQLGKVCQALPTLCKGLGPLGRSYGLGLVPGSGDGLGRLFGASR